MRDEEQCKTRGTRIEVTVVFFLRLRSSRNHTLGIAKSEKSLRGVYLLLLFVAVAAADAAAAVVVVVKIVVLSERNTSLILFRSTVQYKYFVPFIFSILWRERNIYPYSRLCVSSRSLSLSLSEYNCFS